MFEDFHEKKIFFLKWLLFIFRDDLSYHTDSGCTWIWPIIDACDSRKEDICQSIWSNRSDNGWPVHDCHWLSSRGSLNQICIDRFIKFLDKCRKDSPVILVGHNIESYDCKVLLHALQNCGKCSDFQRNVTGFLDT